MQEDSFIPDFSGDDFANDKNILKYRETIRLHKQMIQDSLDFIGNELGLHDGSHKNLKTFLMFKNLQPIVLESLSADNSFHVSLVEYSTSIPTPRMHNSGSDEYLFGLITLKKTYPNTYIYKETLKERLADLILRNELDFEHSKKFSRQFYVLTEDKKNLSDILQLVDLNPLTVFPNMELELQGNKCLFRNSRKPISQNEATQFCKLAKLLVKTF